MIGAKGRNLGGRFFHRKRAHGHAVFYYVRLATCAQWNPEHIFLGAQN